MGKHFNGKLNFRHLAGIELAMTFINITIDTSMDIVKPLGDTIICQQAEPWPAGMKSPNGVPGWVGDWQVEATGAYRYHSDTRYFFKRDIDEYNRKNFRDFLLKASDIVGSHVEGLSISFNYAMGYGSEVALKYANDTSVHPQVYEAIGTVKVLMRVNGIVPTTDTPINDTMTDARSSLQDLFDTHLPRSGIYFNEGPYDVERYEHKYWDSANYGNLVEVHKALDPHN